MGRGRPRRAARCPHRRTGRAATHLSQLSPRVPRHAGDAHRSRPTRPLPHLRRDAHGLHETPDCHHSTFRWIEQSIYSIGRGEQDIPTRRRGAERERLGRLLLSYTLGLDQWLAGVSIPFLLLDLGHLEVGFDPKNEILRVYAYLGEQRTPLQEWLAGCLWHSLRFSLLRRNADQALVERAAQAGLRLDRWIEERSIAG